MTLFKILSRSITQENDTSLQACFLSFYVLFALIYLKLRKEREKGEKEKREGGRKEGRERRRGKRDRGFNALFLTLIYHY